MTGVLGDRRRAPDRPPMPALTDAECSVIDHYLAVVDLTARINPARGTEARELLAALELMWARGEREIHVPTLTQALRSLDGERRAARVTIPPGASGAA